MRPYQVVRALLPHLAAFADELERIEASERAERAQWLDQADSPLGRRHCAVVRARIGRGEPGACVLGRRHLLSEPALAAELERIAAGGGTPAAKPVGAAAELRRQLALVGGRR